MNFTTVLPSSLCLDLGPSLRCVRRAAGVALAAFGIVALVPATAKAAPECERMTFTVALSSSAPASEHMVGWLCGHDRGRSRTLQVLVHGATYNHTYWDWPQNPIQYSYVLSATEAGFATLNLDRVGAGISDHPPSDQLTTAASAFTVHQAIQALRAGTAHTDDGRPVQFDRIILVGHSLGSLIDFIEAETYSDVDGVIASGISHLTDAPGNASVFASLYPAQADPLFAAAGLDSGYLTTMPGTRAGIFYHTPNADPSVIALDEATKDVLPLITTTDFFSGLPLTPSIHVPVLGVVGNFDILGCRGASCSESGSFAEEANDYSPDACFTPVVIPDAGHDLNLHRNAPVWFSVAQSWAALRVGVLSSHPAPRPCSVP